MWMAIISGLVIYGLFKFFFYDDDVLDVGTYDSSALFFVASRLEKLYGGKAYAGLHIPDADTGSRQNIDIVLITERETMVIAVQNLSGLVSLDGDGSWVSTGVNSHKKGRHPNPVLEVKRQIPVLESYLDQRGCPLPEGYLSYKVVCPNPNFCPIRPDDFPPEVITYEQWVHLKPGWNSMLSGWIKGAFGGAKKEMQESFHQKLNFILSTAPTWDRLELKGNKFMLGEFLEFKGKDEDIQLLREIRRSKVGRLITQNTSMFGLVRVVRASIATYASRIHPLEITHREVEARLRTPDPPRPCNAGAFSIGSSIYLCFGNMLWITQLIQNSKFCIFQEIIEMKEPRLLSGMKLMLDQIRR